MKASWKYMGCSGHKVPSLSNTAMRCAGGTNVGVPGVVTSVTNWTIARFAGPSFQEASGVCANVGQANVHPMNMTAKVKRRAARIVGVLSGEDEKCRESKSA